MNVPLPTRLRRAWSAETSSDPEGWTSQRPSHGQCAVTALVVQDEWGGQLLRTTVDGVSHYWNWLADPATEVDLTRDQFDHWEPSEVVERDREYVLSFPETARRYSLLKTALIDGDAGDG